MPISLLPSSWILLKTTLAFSQKHWPRTLLLIFGIALGVSAVIAIDIAKSSVGKSFTISTDLLTGKATHRIVGSDFRIDQEVFVDLKMKLGIDACTPVISDFVTVAAFGDKEMQLIGIDPFAESAFREFSTQNSRSLPILDPFTVMISKEMADRFGIEKADRIVLSFGKETMPATVAGFLTSSEPWLDQAYNGIILSDIATAQELLRMGSDITHIDLILSGEDVEESGNDGKRATSAEQNKSIDPQEGTPQMIGSMAVQNGAVERQEETIRALLPPGATLIRTAHQNSTIRSLSTSFETSLSAFSMLSLFMAMFLIYNTVSFSVAQRRRLVGILRSLGATRQNIFNMILLEIACYALIGAVLGMGLGVILGKGAVQAVCQTVSGMYFPLIVSQTHVTLSVLIKGGLAGIVAAVAASLFPALEATRFPPVTLAVRSDTEERIRKRVPMLALIGGALFILAVIIFLVPHGGPGIDFIALFMTFTGAAFMVPQLTLLSIHGVMVLIKWGHVRTRERGTYQGQGMLSVFGKIRSRMIRRLRPSVLTVMALNNIVRGLSRTTILIASLTVVISVYIGIGTMTASFRQSVVTWVDDNIGGDIHIRSADRRVPSLDPMFVKQVLDLPEVVKATTYSMHRIFSDRSGEVHLFSYKTDYSKREWVWTAEDHEKHFKAGGIYVSEIFAQRHEISHETGSQAMLSTNKGEQAFPVVGIFRDFFMGGGRIIVSRETMKSYWGFDDITSMQLFLTPEALSMGPFVYKGDNEKENGEANEVTQKDGIDRTMYRVRALMGEMKSMASSKQASTRTLTLSPIEMRRGDTIKEGVLAVFDQTFMITTALQLLTAIVALTGIVNSVMALLLERVREIGILRACGAEVRQVIKLLLMECGVCGFLSGLFAIPLGGFISWVLIDVINRRSFGWSYDLVFQGDMGMKALFWAVIAALIAAAIPAGRMGRRNIAAALRME